MDYQTPTELEEMGKPKHVLHGKRGAFMETVCKDGVLRNYIWQNSGDSIVRGYQRRGIKAADFDLETSALNEKTSPRLEIPRVVVDTMRFDIRSLNAQDVAVFWRLFAQARHHGIEDATATISLPALKAFLGTEKRARILASVDKLTKTTMSLHVNMHGAHGRIEMPMLEGYEIEGDIITFSMPSVLRAAVCNSRDYGWVDINAIAHFRSKFTAKLFIKASFEAGKHWSKRQTLGGSRAKFAAALGIPATAQTSVVEDAIARVRDDLLAISGPRRRFKLEFDLGAPTEDVFIEVGASAKKLKEVRPKRLTKEALDQVKADNLGHNRIAESRYPTLIRFQQAATWLNSSVLFVAEQWRLEVYGAVSGAKDTFVGLSGREFVNLVDTHGADDVLEFWLDKNDFSHLGTYNKAVDVGEARAVSEKKKVAVVAEVEVRETEEIVADEYRMGEDFGVLDYGVIEMPTAEPAAENYDDCDIPF